MSKPLRVLVAGCGHMGTSHARAYHNSPAFEIVGLVSRGRESRERLSRELGGYPTYADFDEALAASSPDVVCIATYPDTHARYARAALNRGCHLFLEKPVASTVDEAESIFALARERNRKVVVGYILQQHPAWNAFVERCQTLGKPLVMRMNLNQQSSGSDWLTHKNIMTSLSPIVDCGVHYVEVMCRMTNSRPVRVHAIGARLSDEIPDDQYNYGHLHVVFEDGSVGWYEAGWGPMISQTAFFVKDVIGPRGSVSIKASSSTLEQSANVDSHTKTDLLLFHPAGLKSDGSFALDDQAIVTADEPDHDALCALEQDYLRRAVTEDLDLESHWRSAVESLRIVIAADISIRESRTVFL